MSYINIRNGANLKTSVSNSFFGLNQKENPVAGEFFDIKNMDAHNYPFISTREPRELSKEFNKIFVTEDGITTEKDISDVRAVISPREDTTANGFCGVIGQSFYYNGVKKGVRCEATYTSDGKYDYGMEIADDGKIQLLWANRIIIIHGYDCKERPPYVYYYDTDDEGGETDYVKSREYETEGNCTPYTIEISNTGLGLITFRYSTTKDIKEKHFNFEVGDEIFVDDVMTYSDSRWKKTTKEDAISATVQKYTETEVMNASETSHIWTIELRILFKNKDGESPFSNTKRCTAKHIYKKIPYMTRLDLHKGRLWGANPNGEYVYASALGELFEFNKFEGLNDDSIFMESSTQGGYVGVISNGENLVAFKKNEMEIIYGELPSEIAVGRRYLNYGCSDMDSCAIIDNILYFMGWDGFYVWSGSRPQLISEKIKNTYDSAYGYTDGKVYYVSAKGKTSENLLFDTRYGLWYKYDDKEIRGHFKINDKIYVLIGDEIYKLKSGTEKIDWYIESTRLFADDFSLKAVNEGWINVKVDADTQIGFFISCDGGKWKECQLISQNTKDGGYKTYRIPIRAEECDWWKYKIEGKGGCIILGIEIINSQGGRIYSNKREN